MLRLNDHGPFAEVSRSQTPFIILYLYEPDQLKEPTVHGSHLRFIHEGLLDLENKLSSSNTNQQGGRFESITVCHSNAVDTLEAIHQTRTITRLLAHEETGHWESYMRDRRVKKWCRINGVSFIEYNQTGVTRCLKHRDDYSKKFKAFISQPLHPTPNVEKLRQRLIQLPNLPGFIRELKIDDDNERWNAVFTEIPEIHRNDRSGRQQFGGETKALATLDSFLQERGSKFSQDISSPNTSWNSCSRLSPYLTWGHVSLRYVSQSLQKRQEKLRQMKIQGRNVGTWLKSLQAFSSRLHWRSHFIQKLESEPLMEKRDLCPAYQHLRRQEGDWNEKYYHAWETGTTGYPFVDACMRCLIEHGWINFRMRAMLVSFACYNLWLDWKRLAPHLARVFLDYEPGIHYPQLQMQAGTTGINAMRVYSVTKQGKDQDPAGKFIRRYVRELERVPDEYIHEPWKMSQSTQKRYKVHLCDRGKEKAPELVSPSELKEGWSCYHKPIVDEKESARIAKTKLSEVRKQESTRAMANQVYQKHGSRNRRSNEMNGRISGSEALPAAREIMISSEKSRQPKIKDLFAAAKKSEPTTNRSNNAPQATTTEVTAEVITKRPQPPPTGNTKASPPPKRSKTDFFTAAARIDTTSSSSSSSGQQRLSSWNCKKCTYLNENKPYGLVCSLCGTER